MPTLLTQCPFCQTSFKVSEEQMQAANGVVRCGSCMEVFLAEQHRIVLKDRTLVTASELPEADPEEALLPEAENTAFDSIDEDTLSPAETPEENESDHTGFFTEAPDEEAEESTTPAVFEEVDQPKSDDVLVFGPWSDKEAESTNVVDLIRGEDIEADQDSDEKAAEAETAVEAMAEDDRKTPLPPWEQDNLPSPEITEEDSSGEEDPSESSDEHPDEEQSQPKDEPVSGKNFASFLNPGGYSMREFSVDHVLPVQAPKATVDSAPVNTFTGENAETPDESEADATEIPDVLENNQTGFQDRIGNLERLDESMNFSEFIQTSEIEDVENDFDQVPEATIDDSDEETEFLEEPPPESIPTLVPDLVASENIPAGLEAQSMAWLQTVPGQSGSSHTATGSNDYTGADEKAVIISNLSELEDEDSLAPLAQENLEAIDEEPVELIKTHDSLRVLKTTAWVTLSLILLIGLSGQYLFYNLDTLVNDPRYDSITTLVCGFLVCPDNQVIDLTNLVTEELDVRTHPTRDDALQVNFIFRNDAAREQRFPLVELNFTDISGEILANRVFTRAEYLPPEMELFTHMPAHSSIQVSLELVDPGTEATGYSLVFRNP